MSGAERDAERLVRDIYDAHYGPLAGWAARLVGDRELGHDFATEAFVRLLRDQSTVHDPRAWLYTVTANLVRDHWRRLGRESAAYGRATAESAVTRSGAGRSGVGGSGVGRSGVGRTAGAGSVEGIAPEADNATRITVRDVVLALPDGLRLPVILHYYADLPVAVVAARLGKSEGAVKRDLFDARRRMAAQLEGVR